MERYMIVTSMEEEATAEVQALVDKVSEKLGPAATTGGNHRFRAMSYVLQEAIDREDNANSLENYIVKVCA